MSRNMFLVFKLPDGKVRVVNSIRPSMFADPRMTTVKVANEIIETIRVELKKANPQAFAKRDEELCTAVAVAELNHISRYTYYNSFVHELRKDFQWSPL